MHLPLSSTSMNLPLTGGREVEIAERGKGERERERGGRGEGKNGQDRREGTEGDSRVIR